MPKILPLDQVGQNLNDVRDQKSERLAHARRIVDAAQAQNREMTAEEIAQSERLLDEATELYSREQRITAVGRINDRVTELGQTEDQADPRLSDPGQPGDNGVGTRADGSLFTFRGRDIWNRPRTRQIELGGRRATAEYRRGFRQYLIGGRLSPEVYSALQTDDDEQAGYLVPPEQFVAELIQEIDDLVFIRQLARVFTVREAKSLGAPKRTAKMATFDWSTEVKAPTADTALKFGKRNLYPHYLTGSILVSRDLLRNAVMDPEAIVRREMARDAGEVEETAYMTGSGAGRPLGVFTASDDGISTSRDVQTDATATETTYDHLVNVKYTLKGAYWPNANWLFHRDALKQIAKLKDTQDRPLWLESLRAGEPDTILGLPFLTSEFVPNTFTASQYIGILGDFSHYWIADALDMEMQRLDELNARTNQVEFIGRLKTDAMPVLEEAFVRVQLAD